MERGGHRLLPALLFPKGKQGEHSNKKNKENALEFLKLGSASKLGKELYDQKKELFTAGLDEEKKKIEEIKKRNEQQLKEHREREQKRAKLQEQRVKARQENAKKLAKLKEQEQKEEFVGPGYDALEQKFAKNENPTDLEARMLLETRCANGMIRTALCIWAFLPCVSHMKNWWTACQKRLRPAFWKSREVLST